MLLSFMFHSVSLPVGILSCEWFLRAALPDSSVPLLEYISLAQYRFYLLMILEQYRSNTQCITDNDDVLKLFKPQVSMTECIKAVFIYLYSYEL